ncbi:hypothetical protein BDN71DRAFT_1429978 [Pleurotus eryngii]|uniref:Uncharacterized protein n=1 Tax=Pleurotus eryngii TaxID=5323 RepID=A0A9P6DHR2_PLEER|nr:hypothetical protein BDN71DRAFT_1429978 [Pleurotus eryngii]
MSHNAKAKAAGISATSFFDLKAELSKQEADFSKSKAAGKAAAVVGGITRPDKKPTVWGRQNKGVKSRAQRDIELEAVSRPTLESARVALERKAKIYDKLKKGKTGGLTDSQYDALLVDFDSKPVSEFFEPDSDDEDESLAVPGPSVDEWPGTHFTKDDPIIEYEDEFGRLRTAPRSEVPRHLLNTEGPHVDIEEELIIRNPVNYFPVYEPSAERIAEIEKIHSEENNPLNIHYDAAREVRAKGAGFYQFSADEQTRRAQMEEMKAAREETEKSRREMGAVDLKPGEVEGMREGDDAAGPASVQSRAMEKRKRDIEERRKALESKRKKVKLSDEDGTHIPLAQPVHADPFAAFEAKQTKTPKPATEAEEFLAQLEKNILGKGA